MDLPQTPPGVPAPGIDPTAEELQAITDVAGIFAWLGTNALVQNALVEELGGGEPRLRDIVYVPGPVWDAAVARIKVPVQDGEPRGLRPLESGHMAMVRRIARLRLGLRAVEGGIGQPISLDQTNGEQAGRLGKASIPMAVTEPKL
eukprot:1309297-Karenia_brevis.AAC.1